MEERLLLYLNKVQRRYRGDIGETYGRYRGLGSAVRVGLGSGSGLANANPTPNPSPTPEQDTWRGEDGIELAEIVRAAWEHQVVLMHDLTPSP